MKICIFTETYYPVVGGGETQARLLAEGLITNGHSVIVLARRSDVALRRQENYDGVSVYRLAPVGSGQLKKWGLLISSLPALVRLRNQYDLIFVSGYRIIGLPAVLVGKSFRKPVVLKADSQGEMSGEYFEGGLKKIGTSRSSVPFRLFLGFRNAILKKADAFSAISNDIASEWTSSQVPSDKIHLIPNGVDTNHFIPVGPETKLSLREKLKLPCDRSIAIYTGRLVSYKGLPLLLQVWNKLRSEQKEILLLLIGTGGFDIHNCERELHDYVVSHQLEQHVCFTGEVQNVAEYLQASDFFVFPTENEAFGASVVEAMACALPVITTPVGALKEIVAHQRTGLLVYPGNRQQLHEALVTMLSDKTQALRLGQAGRQIVEERYSVNSMTGKYLALFNSTLQLKRKGIK
jgi:glycosyltransferase involved in cell wall biosynthesis